MTISGALGRQISPGMALPGALGRRVGSGTTASGALGRQSGPGSVIGSVGRRFRGRFWGFPFFTLPRRSEVLCRLYCIDIYWAAGIRGIR